MSEYELKELLTAKLERITYAFKTPIPALVWEYKVWHCDEGFDTVLRNIGALRNGTMSVGGAVPNFVNKIAEARDAAKLLIAYVLDK